MSMFRSRVCHLGSPRDGVFSDREKRNFGSMAVLLNLKATVFKLQESCKP